MVGYKKFQGESTPRQRSHDLELSPQRPGARGSVQWEPTSQQEQAQLQGREAPLDSVFTVNQLQAVQTWQTKLKLMLFHGGSSTDAWFTMTAAQVGQALLTIPYSMAQLGMAAGVLAQLIYAGMAAWSALLLNTLFLEYQASHRAPHDPLAHMEHNGQETGDSSPHQHQESATKQQEPANLNNSEHQIQYHEVLGELTGPAMRHAALFFNVTSLLGLTVVQIIACASDAYYLWQGLTKRSWAIIFSILALGTTFLPTFSNYRVFSVVGVVGTTFTSMLMLATSATSGPLPGVTRTGPPSFEKFWVGATNILFVFGGHAMCVEHAMHVEAGMRLNGPPGTSWSGQTRPFCLFGCTFMRAVLAHWARCHLHKATVYGSLLQVQPTLLQVMNAMSKPDKFQFVYPLSSIFILFLTVPSSASSYFSYGDTLLDNANVFGVLPASPARSFAICLMIAHQAIAFGLFALPLFYAWEKVVGTHQSPYWIRVLSRFPVVASVALLALAFPMFGVVNSLIGALTTSFSSYVMPSAAFLLFYRSPERQAATARQPLTWLGGWRGMFVVCWGVGLWGLIAGFLLGGWAAIQELRKQIAIGGVFDPCYQCFK